MPMPANGTPWPPKAMSVELAEIADWDAWYTGSPNALTSRYATRGHRPRVRPAQLSGGIVGRAARWFWGTPQDPHEASPRLHLPLASDIARASANQLYETTPTLTIPGDDRLTEHLAERVAASMHDALLDGAELGAALGGRYLRATFDDRIDDGRCFLTTLAQDHVLPTFTWGRLTAATIWTELATDDHQVWRHLEHHELDPAGNGHVFHRLYQGSADNLGRAVPVTEHPATAHLADMLTDGDRLNTPPTPGLAVVYIPNITPARAWRRQPLGAHMGRADIAGSENLLDAADEVLSSWLRDIRLGRSRLVVPEAFLDTNSPGQGPVFDTSREIFTTISTPLPPGADAITPVQFNIRVTEHQATLDWLIRRAIASAGYSQATFGDQNGDVEITATEVRAREAATRSTIARKTRAEKAALAAITRKMLAIDHARKRLPFLLPDRVTVELTQAPQAPTELAGTVQMLRAARAISTRTAVEMAHPDWDTHQVDSETDAILAEEGAGPLPDPAPVY